jgi:flagellar biosynthetic protein FlhB
MAGEERTEAATPRKLQRLRDDGKASKSPEVVSAAGLMASVLTLYAFGGTASHQLHTYIDQTLREAARPDLNDVSMGVLSINAFYLFVTVLAPLLVAMPLIGVIANIGQVGFMLSGKAVMPDFERINPLSGARRLFSMRILIELLKTTIKLSVVGWLLYRTYMDAFPQFLSLVGADLPSAISQVVSTAFSMAMTVGSAFLVMAMLDYGYQRWEFLRGAKMTKQEVKEEYKQSEGSPEIRAAIRRRQKRMAMSRMMQNVPKADVVVTNPTHFAVALSYRGDEMAAPKVIAKGQDLIAQRIKQIARDNGVPVVENKLLARTLFKTVEVDQEIPYDLFQAVAQVLAYIYSLKKRPSQATYSAPVGV